MLLIFTLLILLNFSTCSHETPDKILLFTHAVSTSHLSFVFNVVEQYPYPKEVYDIRWPMVELVYKHPTRPGFHPVIFSSTMDQSDVLKGMVDASANEQSGSFFYVMFNMLGSAMGKLLRPCSFEDPIPIENASLALIDPFATQCGIAIARKLGAKYVYVSPLVEPGVIAGITGSALYPSYMMSAIVATAKMDFWLRTANVFGLTFFKIFFYQLAAAKWMFPEYSRLFSMPNETLLLLNSHKYFEFPYPRTNALIDVGNSYSPIKGNLSQEHLDFIEAYDQVVLFSFSTYANDGKLPEKQYEAFIASFKKFPKVGFLFRQKEDLGGYTKNVKMVDWINQRAFLAHPKAAALITHCGQNSVIEGINSGVPMIGIPTMGDQFPNGERILRHSMGIVLNWQALTADDVTKALHDILEPGNIYAKNSRKLAQMMAFEKSQGIAPEVSWTLGKFQKTDTTAIDRYYIPKGARISWFDYFGLGWLGILTVLMAVIS